MEFSFKSDIGGKTLTIQAGKIAKQASGSVLVSYGDTMVLVTVVAAEDERENTDFLPLSVEYQEKIYAAGRIPGNYFRREIGRPSEKEILTCRLIDRPIRPLFPKGYRYETQVIATVLSMDKENDPDVLAMVGTSAALVISDIPFQGPIAAVRVGRLNGEFIANPTLSECDQCDINVVVAGSKTGVVMVEGGANMVSEGEMLEAILFGHEAMQSLIDIQEKLRDIVGVDKRQVVEPATDPALVARIEAEASQRIREALNIAEKTKRSAALRDIKNDILQRLAEEEIDGIADAGEIFNDIKKRVSRSMVLDEQQRIGGRAFDEVRPITCEAGILPRPHGSALFTRGETQVLGVMTLGTGQDEQRVETLSGEQFRPFMLHYNFPPYSVGEVRRIGGPSRRDIGHGALATRALEKVLPDKEAFDYTIRLVSEVFESNGSSSMGTVCAGSLALMDGGVPIKGSVSGIAMGLIKEGDRIAILSDILGDEDHFGDMDFKVAGTRDGVTALQMDIKIAELSKDIMEKALEQARRGRIHILDEMMGELNESRKDLSPYAPKNISLKINPDRIRDIIGPGGKVIRAIQAETNTRIDIDDSGLVKVSALSQEDGDAAIKMIKDIVVEPEVGEVYEGTVVKVTDFGAFVQIAPGTDGLVHISQLSNRHVRRVTDVVKEGETLKVKVLEVSPDGKIRLSHKALLEDTNDEPERK